MILGAIRLSTTKEYIMQRTLRHILTLILVSTSMFVAAQNASLANQYYNSGEYEKAAQMYKLLFDKRGNNDYYFNKYMECLLATDNYDEAEKSVRDEIKKRPQETQLYIYLGNVYEQKGELDKADKQYQKAIDNIPNNPAVVSKMGSNFARLRKNDLAIKVYERGDEISKEKNLYAYNLAILYQRTGQKDKMIDSYLNSTGKFQSNLNTLLNTLERTIDKEDFPLLQAKIYERLKEEDADPKLNEVLQWTFITNEEYKKAFRQARAMDRQGEQTGDPVLRIANIAFNAEDYETAIDAYDYVTELGEANPLHLQAKRGLLNSKKSKILNNPNYTKEELLSLEKEYISFLESFGANRETAVLMNEFANFEALFLDNIDTAVVILNKVIDLGDISDYIRSDAKLDLADYLLISGDRWESTLLYSQVDKAMKEAEQGEQARFRNAMLSYYNGDFEWAQEQFDILKRATSKLISNDAIDMSVFILDNLGLDTTDVPLKMFSESDLLIFQNKYDDAFKKLDEIQKLFPEHGLTDDILYRKAHMHAQKRNYDTALELYEKVYTDYPEEIRADNSIFRAAEIYETVKEDKEKAQKLYEKIFLDYTGSTFAVEARKRYRLLRGDEI